MKPIWLLDVDGVVGPFGTPPWPDEPIDTRIWGLGFTYSPLLISEIRRLSNVVEIRWLTSWENAAAQHLAPALGLPPFPVQLSVTADKEWDSAGLHWKTGETLEVLKERRPVIWTDDDAWAFDDEEDTVASTSRLPNMTLQESVVRTAASDVPLLMIAPDRRLGLTPEHIATIDAFARLHST